MASVSHLAPACREVAAARPGASAATSKAPGEEKTWGCSHRDRGDGGPKPSAARCRERGSPSPGGSHVPGGLLAAAPRWPRASGGVLPETRGVLPCPAGGGRARCCFSPFPGTRPPLGFSLTPSPSAGTANKAGGGAAGGALRSAAPGKGLPAPHRPSLRGGRGLQHRPLSSGASSAQFGPLLQGPSPGCPAPRGSWCCRAGVPTASPQCSILAWLCLFGGESAHFKQQTRNKPLLPSHFPSSGSPSAPTPRGLLLGQPHTLLFLFVPACTRRDA